MACSNDTGIAHRKVAKPVNNGPTNMSNNKITVTSESDTGRNTRFHVPGHGEIPRQTLVQQIRAGEHEGYHVRVINRVATPVSNPNGNSDDNLG
jgi:hypothetical protein